MHGMTDTRTHGCADVLMNAGTVAGTVARMRGCSHGREDTKPMQTEACTHVHVLAWKHARMDGRMHARTKTRADSQTDTGTYIACTRALAHWH